MACFIGQLICVVSCVLSLANGFVLSAVCFHWSTGLCWQLYGLCCQLSGFFLNWSRGLCCQLSAFIGQRLCAGGCVVCVVICLLSLVNGSVLSAVCFHWSTGLCCQLSAFTGQRVAYFNDQRVCVVSCVLSLVNGCVLSAVCFHWSTGGVLSAVCFHWSTGLCCQLSDLVG